MHKRYMRLLGSGARYGVQHVPGPYYLLNDTFTTDRAAGAVQGTLAEPGLGVREIVVDTNNKLSISGGKLVFATGGAATGNPALWYAAVGRIAGRIAIARMTVTSGVLGVGWDNVQTGGLREAVRLGNTLSLWATGIALTVGAATLGVTYDVITILRTAGAISFIKGGIYTNWTLLYTSNISTESVDYPGIAVSGTGVAGNLEFFKIPALLWLPSPSASDGFSAWGTADGLGHAEGVAGGLGAGGNALSWTQPVGTWTASGGLANASALSGGVAIATVDTGKADVLATAKLTHVGGTGSVVVRYADGNNFVRLSHTGTNVQLVKLIAGASTTVLDSAQTYVAGAELLLVCDGSEFRCFYNNLAVGGAQTIADAAVATATKQGLRTSDTGNQFDDFVVRARGTGGEYAILDTI